MTHRRLNVRMVSGTVAFFAMLAAPGACDEGTYMTCIALVGIFAVCTHLAMRKDGKLNRPHALVGRGAVSYTHLRAHETF